MARGRPHGRSKSDHRVCQAARYARAADYRERISISAEQQEARIAAVNAEGNVEDAPRRRRGQKSRESRTKAGAARVSAGGRSCKASGSAKKGAKKGLEHALGKAAERDPHALHCHQCGATAEFGVRGGKEGGEVKYLCRGHTPTTGCFRIDKDRADWAEDREMRRLRAEERRLEGELQNLGGTSFAAEPAAAWNESQSMGNCSSMPMSKSLIATLLMIGGVERNPGPTAEEIALMKSWQEAHPKIKTRLLDHLMRKEFELEDWEATPLEDRVKYLTQWRAEYQGDWPDGWDGFLKAVPFVGRRGQDTEAGHSTDVEMRDAEQGKQNDAGPSGSRGPSGRGQLRGDQLSLWNERLGSGYEGLNDKFILPRTHLVESVFQLLDTGGFAFLQGPPYGGKTTMLQLVLRYAEERGVKTHYINLSAGTGNVDSFVQLKLGANPFNLMDGDNDVLIAFDEAQSSYNQRRTKSGNLWGFLKQLQSRGKCRVRAIVAAAYGARPSGLQPSTDPDSPHGTPFAIPPNLVISSHPPSQTMPVSLKLLLTEYEELCSLFEDFSGLHLSKFTLEYIRDLSGLQVGGATFCMKYLNDNLSNEERADGHRDTAALYKLNSVKFHHGLETVRSILPYGNLTKEEKDILTALFWAEGDVPKVRFQHLEKTLSGLKKKGQVVINDHQRVTFTSPLHKIYFGIFHFSRSRRPSTSGMLHDFVVDTISLMDPQVLRYTESLSTKHEILERLWQMEGFRAGSIVVPEDSYMSPDVGWTLGIKGWCDFYIGHPCCWALEFIAGGDKIAEHLARFASGGEYYAMLSDGRVHDWACVDFRSPGSVVTPSIQHPHLYTVVFLDDTYEKATLFHQGQQAPVRLGGYRELYKYEDVSGIEDWVKRARGV